MSETENYVIGFDLGNEYAQISFVTFEEDPAFPPYGNRHPLRCLYPEYSV